MRKTEFISLFVIFIIYFISLQFYGVLPDKIPAHWNISGNPDLFLSKNIVLMIIPVIATMIFVLLYVISRVKNVNKQLKYLSENDIVWFDIFVLFFIVTLLYFQIIIIQSAINGKTVLFKFVPLVIALYFYLIGFISTKFHRNRIIGFRTPFALQNDIVWQKTQIAGFKVFKLSAIAVLIISILGKTDYLFYTIVLTVLVSVVYVYWYSYTEYLKIVKEKKNNGN